MSENQIDNKYLIFILNNTLYGLDILNVTEIIEYKKPTKIPGLPNYIHGLLNLRGKVLPIIDFNLYLGLSGTLISKKTCAVIINYLSSNVLVNIGVLVDDVLDVTEIDPESLNKAPDFGVKIKSEFIKHMIVINNQIITLLNINKIFSEKDLHMVNKVNDFNLEKK